MNANIDPRLVVPSYIGKPDVRFFSIDEAPFKICGVFREGEQYRRLPGNIANLINTRAKKFSTATAGGRIRFKTDSTYVAIRAHIGDIYRVPMLTLTASAGFDLYEGERFLGSFNPPSELHSGGVFEAVINLGERKERELTIHMPLYSAVLGAFVGIDGAASLSATAEYRIRAPIVFYGSSITHGACASRPGMTYTAMIARRMNADIINLGFGAGCRGESELAEYIGGVGASALICAYDYNAPNSEKLLQTHKSFYEAVRRKDGDLPILFVSRPEVDSTEDGEIRRNIIMQTYMAAREKGDRNVYYLDGRTLISTLDYTHDGIHPNDIGQKDIADALEKQISKIIGH